MKGILGKKLGMTQIFDPESGSMTPVTVIQAGPCPVVAIRTEETDGYASGPARVRRGGRPQALEAEARAPEEARRGSHRRIVEIRGRSELTPGESVTVEAFTPGDRVKVAGTGIGKGFAGTIKRHNFSRGPVTHGSHNIRQRGSIGASATPSRVFKGMKMAGRMGGKRVTQVGLTVHSVEPEQNLIVLKGAVPGPKNGFVEIREDTNRGRA